MVALGILFFILLLLGFTAVRVAHYKLEFSGDTENRKKYLAWHYVPIIIFIICAAIFVAIFVNTVF